MFDFNKNLEYSHSFLNSLYSAEQGEFAYYNILSQLQGKSNELAENISTSKIQIEKIAEWLDQMWSGVSLFMLSWKSPEGEDPKQATSMLMEKRDNLIAISKELTRILGSEDFDQLPAQDIQFVIAALGRHRYAQDNYLRGMLELMKALEVPQDATRYEELVENSAEDITFLHEALKHVKGGEYQGDTQFFNALYAEAVLLSGSLRAHIHDMSQLISVYEGPFSYELAGIPEKEAADWHSVNISPYEAGYWRAYFIGPDEVFGWIDSGFSNYADAGSWRLWGFPHNVASQWNQQQFSPEEASYWSNADISVAQASKYRQLGINHPAEL